MSTPHVGDFGTTFRIRFVERDANTNQIVSVDISSATTKKIRFRKPDDTFVEKTGTFTTDGTDGELEYIAETGVLDAEGYWWIDGEVAAASYRYYSKKTRFTVEAPLS